MKEHGKIQTMIVLK
ncbi:unnamed protein product [Acanthoscelides obtectus]|uniref:Uncharacterized protein n=1 Tax=Acanthoscelides obtectus TaxID=200917 RepID=A0A9P0PBN4_ACAOB|nr:unnamed protein product [Acanthoscelides obtectus]CAK1657759.1 hypothetical protein AOBTE_LOCUS20521 [Acanthoscelides obtectus]